MKTMNMCRYKILPLALFATCLVATAEDEELQKAIVVEKDFVPVEQKAEKPGTLPDALPSEIRKVTLDFSDWTIPAQLNPGIITQSPILRAESLKFSKQRGYADFAMGNYWNIAGSAGYRFIAKPETQLGAWFQHNSTNGKVSPSDFDPKKSVVEDKIGLDFSHRFSAGTLAADASYHFDKFNYMSERFEEKQKVNEFGLNLSWDNHPTSANNVRYYAGLGYNYFGNDLGLPAYWGLSYPSFMGIQHEFANEATDGMTENLVRAKGGVEIDLGGSSYAGMDAGYLYAGYRLDENGVSKTETENMLSLTPYYSKRTENLNLRIGALVDLAFTNGQFFHIAPDVKLEWAMSRKVGLFASATGGNRVNTFHEMAARNRYVHPTTHLPKTYTALDATVGLNFGPVKGLTVSPFVGYAVVENSLVPVGHYLLADLTGLYDEYTIRDFSKCGYYSSLDLSGFKAGIDVNYRYGDKAELTARYLFTPQGDDSGYVSGDDRAEHSLYAKLRVSPIKPLDVYVDYTLRSGRRSLNRLDVVTNFYGRWYTTQLSAIRLENISNIGIGADYRINELLNAFVQVNNLLNRRYQDYYELYAQRFNFLVGIGVVF